MVRKQICTLSCYPVIYMKYAITIVLFSIVLHMSDHLLYLSFSFYYSSFSIHHCFGPSSLIIISLQFSMEEEKTPELDPTQVNPYSVEKISVRTLIGGMMPQESALCMICFKPLCDIICKGRIVVFVVIVGPCSRTFHSCCIRLQGGKSKSWRCPMCTSKEVEVFRLFLHFSVEIFKVFTYCT